MQRASASVRETEINSAAPTTHPLNISGDAESICSGTRIQQTDTGTDTDNEVGAAHSLDPE